MPYAEADDGIRLYYEETGSGIPIVFVHEFGGNYQSWEPQVRRFSRLYRCVTFSARGYLPSDVPDSMERYTQDHAVSDIVAVLDHLGIDEAHVVGHSMGAFAALHFGLKHAGRARSLLASGVGYGTEAQYEEYFRNVSLEVASQFESRGSKAFAEIYGSGASRIQFRNKDPRGWREFVDLLAMQSDKGAANTMRGVQARRPNLIHLADQLAKMQVPTLIVCGDEDDHTLQFGIQLKRIIPACGLLVMPKTGHTMNLEEPEFFNRALADFLAAVELGKWSARDPGADPNQILRTR